MSEQGWREFLASDGVDDWVVLHGGATAVFGVGSLGEAARLAEAIADVPLEVDYERDPMEERLAPRPEISGGSATCRS